MGKVDSSRVRCWESSDFSTVDGLVGPMSKVTVTGRPRSTRSVCSEDMSIFRGHTPLGGKKLLSDGALVSAGSCLGVAGDSDKIFGPSESMLFGSTLCHAPQCVIFKVWCQVMCFMTWSVMGTSLSEQGLLGQHWTQLVQHEHCVSLEIIPVKLSCSLAQISACSELLVHSGMEPRSTNVGWMPRHFEKWGRVPTWLCACSAQEERAEAHPYLQ